MTVKIRMSRGGRKKQPFYHIVAADERSPRDGRYIEKLGYYNPNLSDKTQRLNWDGEKVAAWLEKGAWPTTTVGKWVHEQKLGPDAMRAKIQRKLDQRIAAVKKVNDAKAAAKAAEEAAAKAEEEAAAAEAAAAEAPAEETPAEETSVDEAPAEKEDA